MMHPAHEMFASRPTFCRLPELLALLDAFDPDDRHEMLAPVYHHLMRKEKFEFPEGTNEDDAKEELFKEFLRYSEALAEHVHYGFVVHGVVHTALVWHCGMSDETRIADAVASNQQRKQDAIASCERGELSQGQLEHTLGEIDEHVNNLRAAMRLRRARYERFCDQVVAKLPGRPSSQA